MIQLSKSDYMLFLKHPAWVWLKKHDKAKLPPVDDSTQSMFDAGHLFEAYAEQLLSGGVRLGFDDFYEYRSLTERTQKALDGGATTIYQGRFEYGRLTFICDVIKVVGDKEVELYEIKSSTSIKPEHEFDLAFQLAVLEGCGYKVSKVAVVHVNNQYARNGKVDPQQLATITDVTEAVSAKRELTQRHIAAALRAIDSATIPDISPSHARLGSLKEWLGIYRGLKLVEPYSIYDLVSVGAAKIGSLEDMGVTKLTDIPDDFALTASQQRQVNATKQDKVLIEAGSIKQFLGALEYPLYFFDYETMAGIIPSFDGLRPYQQLPFQYSLHILDAPGAELRHEEYLQRDNANPAEPLSQALRSQIGAKGSVITWNMGFEKSCNTMLGSLLPEYADFYEGLNERIVDLMWPFSKGWYVDKAFMGSASIKSVLPVLVPELSYEALGIKDGSSAQRLWMEAALEGKREADKAQIFSDLVKYCELDTLAMVEIYKKLSAL